MSTGWSSEHGALLLRFGEFRFSVPVPFLRVNVLGLSFLSIQFVYSWRKGDYPCFAFKEKCNVKRPNYIGRKSPDLIGNESNLAPKF